MFLYNPHFKRAEFRHKTGSGEAGIRALPGPSGAYAPVMRGDLSSFVFLDTTAAVPNPHQLDE